MDRLVSLANVPTLRAEYLKGYTPIKRCLVYVVSTALSIGNLEQCISRGADCTTWASQWEAFHADGARAFGAPLAFPHRVGLAINSVQFLVDSQQGFHRIRLVDL